MIQQEDNKTYGPVPLPPVLVTPYGASTNLRDHYLSLPGDVYDRNPALFRRAMRFMQRNRDLKGESYIYKKCLVSSRDRVSREYVLPTLLGVVAFPILIESGVVMTALNGSRAAALAARAAASGSRMASAGWRQTAQTGTQIWRHGSQMATQTWGHTSRFASQAWRLTTQTRSQAGRFGTDWGKTIFKPYTKGTTAVKMISNASAQLLANDGDYTEIDIVSVLAEGLNPAGAAVSTLIEFRPLKFYSEQPMLTIAFLDKNAGEASADVVASLLVNHAFKIASKTAFPSNETNPASRAFRRRQEKKKPIELEQERAVRNLITGLGALFYTGYQTIVFKANQEAKYRIKDEAGKQEEDRKRRERQQEKANRR